MAHFYRHAANQGDVQAQVVVGQLYYFGARGVRQDYAQAFNYFNRAAAQGEAMAMVNLGQMYASGLGVEQNNDTAYKYFKEAADKGSMTAQNGLGFMYLNGMGVPKDPKVAFTYFKKSADAGNADAQYNLATLYYAGKGTKEDPSAALQFFTLASQQGHTRAMYNLAQMHFHGVATPKSCPLADKLYKVVAEKGEWADTIKQAFVHHTKGQNLKAFIYYAMAAEEGHEIAQYNAAWLLHHGVISNDTSSEFYTNRYAKAFYFWTLYAEQGSSEALRMVGDYYYYDKLQENIEHENADTINEEKEEIFEPDFEVAAQSYLSAAELKNAQAMYNVGYMYEHGLGFAKDLHLAKRYYDLSLVTDPNGYVPVKIALARLWVEINWDELIVPTLVDYGILPPSYMSATSKAPKEPDQTPHKENIKSEHKDDGEEISAMILDLFREILGDWIRCWEDVLIVIVALSLAFVVYLRRAHI